MNGGQLHMCGSEEIKRSESKQFDDVDVMNLECTLPLQRKHDLSQHPDHQRASGAKKQALDRRAACLFAGKIQIAAGVAATTRCARRSVCGFKSGMTYQKHYTVKPHLS
jgi:hypothetical protein